jgi:hypothetical protein
MSSDDMLEMMKNSAIYNAGIRYALEEENI